MLGGSVSRGESSGGGTSYPVYMGRLLWHPPLWKTERTMTEWCIQRAIFGKCSQRLMPGALVAMGLNSPRIPTGASGLRSNMSCVAGPPCK
jgi:hypothetical protein